MIKLNHESMNEPSKKVLLESDGEMYIPCWISSGGGSSPKIVRDEDLTDKTKLG